MLVRMATTARTVSADFTRGAAVLPHLVRTTVIHHAMLLQTRAKARASGRPGPNAPTGDYRRSIQRRTSRDIGDGSVTAEVGTNKPQGRRLELGFTGVDAIGRFYDQPPYPHFGPALDETGSEFQEAMAKAVERALAGPGGAR